MVNLCLEISVDCLDEMREKLQVSYRVVVISEFVLLTAMAAKEERIASRW